MAENTKEQQLMPSLFSSESRVQDVKGGKRKARKMNEVKMGQKTKTQEIK